MSVMPASDPTTTGLAAPSVAKTRRGSGPPQILAILGVLLVMGAVLTFTTSEFLTETNLLNVARQVSLIVIVGMGMTFLLTSGGMDISVGAVVAFSGTLAAGLCVAGWPMLLAFLAATLVGGLIGALHGLLIVRGGMSPIIVTLGTMFAVRGIAYLYTSSVSGGTSISLGLPDSFTALGSNYVLGVPVPVIIAVVAVGVFWFLFNRTLLGKHTRAVGGNGEAARLSGVGVGRVLFTIYTITGLLAGFSGVILASRLASGQPSAGDGFEFDVIIAVLIGGTSLFGGKGTIVGTVIGGLIIGVLSNGLTLLGTDSNWQQVVKGAVLVAAVLLDTRVRARRAA
ncbi:Ribose import permease protein RbsC [Baekduia alba]|uniref:ABC transporter permease n=1 Tax=Baekduia alba TaxID=2997333 RepID=UPI0023424740|nr:ABC transporter permease [Baekduia alba]WCB94863.1 Ribose import permease protein RbsC [Baekduia alba]